ncbi:hypothetical protein ACCS54_18825 [Rhizobium johnstonii]|uniref:hypothetical protein n=1 Tax=Rhizobium johnstonii TaxID=3019933 RepID=UPI003F9856FA
MLRSLCVAFLLLISSVANAVDYEVFRENIASRTARLDLWLKQSREVANAVVVLSQRVAACSVPSNNPPKSSVQRQEETLSSLMACRDELWEIAHRFRATAARLDKLASSESTDMDKRSADIASALRTRADREDQLMFKIDSSISKSTNVQGNRCSLRYPRSDNEIEIQLLRGSLRSDPYAYRLALQWAIGRVEEAKLIQAICPVLSVDEDIEQYVNDLSSVRERLLAKKIVLNDVRHQACIKLQQHPDYGRICLGQTPTYAGDYAIHEMLQEVDPL